MESTIWYVVVEGFPLVSQLISIDEALVPVISGVPGVAAKVAVLPNDTKDVAMPSPFMAETFKVNRALAEISAKGNLTALMFETIVVDTTRSLA